jgi:hypothetical protein
VLNYYREGELTNGRWAMAAVAGILFTELVRQSAALARRALHCVLCATRGCGSRLLWHQPSWWTVPCTVRNEGCLP